jgi:hypothetical protein
MPQTKTKPQRAEDDDDDLPAAEDPAPERGPETMHDREHLGHEVASDLTLGGLSTFLSVTTRGVNLVAGNTDLTMFVPVRVVTLPDEDRLELKPDDAKALSPAGGVVAFLIGDEDDRDRYYGKRPVVLSITHNLGSQLDPEEDVGKQGEPAQDDHVAGRRVILAHR